MNTKNVLTITAILSIVYAATLIAMPEKFLEMRGINTDAIGMVFMHVLGANALGWALLAWFGRNLTGDALRPILIAMIGGWGLSGVLIARAMMTLQMNTMGWMDVAISFVFALVFAYFLFVKKS